MDAADELLSAITIRVSGVERRPHQCGVLVVGSVEAPKRTQVPTSKASPPVFPYTAELKENDQPSVYWNWFHQALKRRLHDLAAKRHSSPIKVLREPLRPCLEELGFSEAEIAHLEVVPVSLPWLLKVADLK
uniref:Uncharacterized protein n=1 Tax=Noctiluca scintillans TaxID=2966 RepID=A0A7S1A653_NOCSC